MRRYPIVINLYGGPCIGKSTVAAGVYSLLKLQGINCELVTEVAKDMTWACRQKELRNQIYIFGNQYHRLWRVTGVDVIITDSPLLLGIVYSKDCKKTFKEHVFDVYNSFKNINFCLNRNSNIYTEIGRNQTKEEAIEIDKKILELLTKLSVDYYEVTSNILGISSITSKILEYFGLGYTKYEIVNTGEIEL